MNKTEEATLKGWPLQRGPLQRGGWCSILRGYKEAEAGRGKDLTKRGGQVV